MRVFSGALNTNYIALSIGPFVGHAMGLPGKWPRPVAPLLVGAGHEPTRLGLSPGLADITGITKYQMRWPLAIQPKKGQ